MSGERTLPDDVARIGIERMDRVGVLVPAKVDATVGDGGRGAGVLRGLEIVEAPPRLVRVGIMGERDGRLNWSSSSGPERLSGDFARW